MANHMNADPQNPHYMKYAVMTEGLQEAVDFVTRVSGTQNILVFDGAANGFNMTEPLAELLRSKVSGIDKKVEGELLPKWCRQRGFSDQVLKDKKVKASKASTSKQRQKAAH